MAKSVGLPLPVRRECRLFLNALDALRINCGSTPLASASHSQHEMTDVDLGPIFRPPFRLSAVIDRASLSGLFDCHNARGWLRVRGITAQPGSGDARPVGPADSMPTRILVDAHLRPVRERPAGSEAKYTFPQGRGYGLLFNRPRLRNCSKIPSGGAVLIPQSKQPTRR